jgi:hypothetical protein
MTYPDFRVQTSEIFRFEAQDTLVFHLLLENQSAHEIAYKAAELSVRVEPQAAYFQAPPIYNASIVDASGLMPAKSVTTAWFAITGTREGGRNELDPARNVFTVLVPRVAFPSAAQSTTTIKPVSLSVDPKDFRNR